MESPRNYEKYAHIIADRLELGATRFGQKSRRAKLFREFSSILELSFAAIAIFSNIPFVVSVFGTATTSFVEWTSLITLFFVILVDRVVGRASPERLQEYDFYMRILRQKLLRCLADENKTKSDSELKALIDISQEHLADIQSKWPDISDYIKHSSSDDRL